MNRTGRLLASLAATAALAAGLLVALGTGGSAKAEPLGSPAGFIVRMIEQKVAGRYAQAWQNLYPAHQRVAPLELYVLCETRLRFPGRLDSVVALSTHPSAVSVAGLARPVRGAAVRVRAIVKSPLLSSPVAITHTFHAVAVGGRWRWLLSPSRFRLYRHGGCAVGYAP